jgi:hypothetical protein
MPCTVYGSKAEAKRLKSSPHLVNRVVATACLLVCARPPTMSNVVAEANYASLATHTLSKLLNQYQTGLKSQCCGMIDTWLRLLF